MKKILFILLAILSLPVFGQNYVRQNVADITGSDTTLYLRNGRHGLLTIDFTTVNGNTSTLDIGYSDDRVSFCSVPSSVIATPVTLTKVTYTKTANGYTRNRIMFSHSSWPGTYIAIKLTKAGVTTGFWDIWY